MNISAIKEVNMSGTPDPVVTSDTVTVGRRRWIDMLLGLGGVACLVNGWWAIGGALMGLALVTPVLHWAGRRGGARPAYHLVPAAVAASHRQLLVAAKLPGVR